MTSPPWPRSSPAGWPSTLLSASASPHDKEFDESFASVPALIVIDGGKGQLYAGLSELGPFRDLGVTIVSLAKRIEEVFLPGRKNPLVLPHDTPELQLLQRVRDEAHRFAIEFHRGRRDKAMTHSILDELPGVGPARKRSILQHFGSPERFLRASPEELEAVPGCRARSHAIFTTTSTRSGDVGVQGHIEDFVVITGFSGAGKSQAMATFEDAGYFCVDNLPPEMIGSLADLFGHEGSQVERAAVASDVRGGDFFDDLVRVLDDLDERGVRTGCSTSRPPSRC